MNRFTVALLGLLLPAVAWAADTVPYISGTSGLTNGNLTKSGSTVGQLQDASLVAAQTPQLNAAGAWTVAQSTSTETPTISTATFTPAGTKQNIRIVLIHASCPCTLANYSTVTAGQSGMLEIVQSSTGSDTIGTYGSKYFYVGGTSAITLSTAANAVDYIPYYVESTGTDIILGGIVKGPAH